MAVEPYRHTIIAIGMQFFKSFNFDVNTTQNELEIRCRKDIVHFSTRFFFIQCKLKDYKTRVTLNQSSF